MMNRIERLVGDLHYFVDPTTPSDIYFDSDTLQRLVESKCDLSITGISMYIRKHTSKYMPVLLTWDMTSRCNFSCPFCYIRDNTIKEEVCFSEAKTVIDGLVEKGLFEVYLSGGECLLLDDFLEIYSYFKTMGVFVTVFTNGSLIDDRVMNCWKQLPPSSVEITLYNDDFASAPFSNMIKLREMGIYVLPKFTLTQTTLQYYENVKKWTDSHSLTLNVDSNLFDGVDDLHANISKRYSISISQKKEYTPNKLKSGEEKPRVRTGFSCNSRKGIVQINPDFSISLCNKMKKRWDLRSIIVDTALSELKALIEKYENAPLNGCNGCIYANHCSMCFANAELINGELFVPSGHCAKLKEECDQYIELLGE